MQAFVSKLMAVLVLTQAVSGWCCHRPCHCSDGDVAEVSLATTEVCGHEDCCHDDHESFGPKRLVALPVPRMPGLLHVRGWREARNLLRSHMALGLDVVATNSDAAQTQLDVDAMGGEDVCSQRSSWAAGAAPSLASIALDLMRCCDC